MTAGLGTLVAVLRLLGLPRRRVVLAVLAGAAALGSATVLLGCSAWLIARASQQPHVNELALVVVAVRALGIGRGVFRYLERLISHDVALTGLVTLRERCYLALSNSPTSIVMRYRRGDLLDRLGHDIDAVGDVVVRGLLPFGSAAVVIGCTAVAFAVVFPPAAVVFLAAAALAGAVAPWLAARGAARAELDAAAAATRVSDGAQTMLDGLGPLEVSGETGRLLAQIERDDAERTGSVRQAQRPAALAAAVQVLATGFAVLTNLWLGSVAVADGRLGPVWLVVVTLLPLAAMEATTVLPAAAVELVRGGRASGRVLELVAHQAATQPDQDPPEPVLALEANRVSTGWDTAVLTEMNLRLDLTRSGSVAVIGPSGVGKTSFLLTLAGLLPPVSGTVDLAGDGARVATAAVAPDRLRSTVLFTAEDAHIFGTSIRENLRVAAGDVPDTSLRVALHRVGLGAWVAGLPAGLDTLLGAGALDISGGQRRRLLLARALLVDAAVMLIDEPTEHLDPESADRLLAELASLPGAEGGPTWVVVATHRRDTADLFDQVLDLETVTGVSR